MDVILERDDLVRMLAGSELNFVNDMKVRVNIRIGPTLGQAELNEIAAAALARTEMAEVPAPGMRMKD